jgi:hypothetical protein
VRVSATLGYVDPPGRDRFARRPDVRARTNSGVGLLSGLCILLLVLCVYFLVDTVRDSRRMSPVRRALAAVRHSDRVA